MHSLNAQYQLWYQRTYPTSIKIVENIHVQTTLTGKGTSKPRNKGNSYILNSTALAKKNAIENKSRMRE